MEITWGFHHKGEEVSLKIFILAGGKGERMFPFSSITPKCLLPE